MGLDGRLGPIPPKTWGGHASDGGPSGGPFLRLSVRRRRAGVGIDQPARALNAPGRHADLFHTMPFFSRARPVLPEDPARWKSGLEAALRISEIASSSAPLADAIDAMLRMAVKLLGAEQGSLMLLADGGRRLEVVASCGISVPIPEGARVPVNEGVAGRVLATGQPLRLGNVDRREFVNFIPKARRIASSVVVPLRVHGRSVGVLSLNIFDGSRQFTDEDVRVAQMFGHQVAGVIYRAQLHERAERRSSDLMALVESSRGLVGTLGLDPLLQRMLDGGTRLAGSRSGFACLFDAETGGIERGVFRGMDKEVIGRVVQTDDVRRALDGVDVVAVDLDDGIGPVVALGLRTARGTRGLLVAKADSKLAEERADLLRAFSQQCSIAVAAAELHAEIGRKESELSSIIHGVPNPIVLADARKRIVALNSAAETLFGVSSTFSVGAPVEGTLGHPDVERGLTGEGPLQAEVSAGNPPQTYKVRVVDVHMPGAPAGRVLLMDDITAEREILQMQRDFVGMVGHELRTPLTIIKGFAWTLRKRAERVTAEETVEVMSTIMGKADQLERLIEDLLYVSSIEAREATLKVDRVNVAKLVTDVSEEVVRDHPTREIVVDVHKSLTWPCDETKIALVLRHLIDNGLKYSDHHHPVVVNAYEDDDNQLHIDVADRGIGILSSDIPYIFERFRQIDNSSTREHGGTGVGLYLSAQLVKMHNGRIEVDSTWGKGSTFSVTIPSSSLGSQVVHIRNSESRPA
jgi:signal transduction histidine kinase